MCALCIVAIDPFWIGGNLNFSALFDLYIVAMFVR